jgi:hypothetical protein
MSDKLLGKPERAGVYHLPAKHRSAVELATRELHYDYHHLEIHQGMSIDAVLARIGEVLHFPDWYGANFDALNDCLADPEGLPGKGHILTIDGCEQILASDPVGYATLLEVFAAAIDDLRKTGVSLWVLLDKPAPGIRTLTGK